MEVLLALRKLQLISDNYMSRVLTIPQKWGQAKKGNLKATKMVTKKIETERSATKN